GANQSEMMSWMRRIARVRPKTQMFHDLLLASEVLSPAPPQLVATQLPVESAPRWVGLPYGDERPSKARIASVMCVAGHVDTSAPFCGLIFDKWTEFLPGLTTVADRAKGHEAAEVTGLAFTVDAPDAYAPQALLLAVPPDPSRGWSLDILFDVVQETL